MVKQGKVKQQIDKPTFSLNKPAELEQAEDKIADIFADAIYSYLIRKGIRKERLADKFEAKGDRWE